MLMQASVHAFFLVFIAIALLGHVPLAEALRRSRGGPTRTAMPVHPPPGTRTPHSLILEAAESG